MDQQPDVQKQQQEQHQSIQDQPNIVYIQQDPQNFRNSNYSYLNEGQNNLIGNQSFQQQNVNFGQFDNFYPFLSNGHFSPPNTSAAIIQNSVDVNKCKNASEILKNSQFLSDNDSNNCHQRNEATLQLANANYQSVDLPGLNYQQASQFFLQNLGNQYQLNDILVQAYQSSGSSESSDESSISNISQQHYPGGSSGLSNNQFEFPVPISTGQLGRNFQQFQQKDFLDNYMALLQQENQIPRCDSSKSEAAESTCSSLSSGSIESQSENENVVRLPVLVNSLVSDNENCNMLHSYQTNTQNNIATYSNQMHQNQTNEIINQRNYNSQSEQNLVKCNSNYPNTINTNNVMNGNIGNVNDVLPPNNQLNNLVVMLPNRINKNIQNCLTTNQSMVQNPSSPDTLSASKFILQNQKLNQQRLFGLINVENQIHEGKMNSPSQLNESLKLNSSLEESSSGSSDLISRNGENNIQSCGNYSSDEDRNNRSVNNSCSAAMVHSVNNHANSVDGNDTSPFQKTSDSSVISSNFFQSNFSTKSIENDTNNSAMLFKETSDKDMSQCINDVNSSVSDTKDVYLIKNDESDVAKNVCYNNDSSAAPCLTTNPTINVIPVPVGWRRLLLEGSIIYLSPSNVALSSMDQVKLYLQTVGTCKCGLECPVNCDSVFNFNPKVISRPWDSSDSELTRLCNHKRKAPPIPVPSVTGVDKNTKSSRKDVIPTKRRKKRHGSGGGVSVSKLLAQRESAMTAAAAAARWSANSQPGNVSYQNVPTNQYQGIQVLRNQTQDRQQVPYENQVADGFKQELPGPVRLPDDKTAQFPCINVVNAPGRDGNMVNVNGVNQMVPENHATKHELMRTSQMTQNSVSNQRRDMNQGVIGHPVSYNQIGQEFLQNAVVAPRPDGVVLAPQGMLFPPNMIMQRPRSIPPWHQARLGLNKKSVPETPVVYERIPCVQQHMPPSTLVFEDPPPRKKHKSSSKTKKTSPPGPRQKTQPSFMDNPSAYLAQQTALLHNTISRPNFGLLPDTHPPNKLPQKLPNSSSTSERNTLGPLKSNSSSSKSTYRSHSSQKRDHQTSFSRLHTYSKSNSDKRNIRSGEVSSGTNSNELQNFTDVRFNNHVCSNSNCVECKKSHLFESSSAKSNSADKQGNEKMKLIQENLQKSKSEIYSKQKYSKSDWKRKESSVSHHRRKSSLTSEDQSCSIEENPVTSTTERAPATYHQRNVSDSRPIQGGTVSTSNGSPQPQPSPNSSNIFKQDVSSPKSSELPSHSPGNILISSSTNSSLAISNSVGSTLLRDNEIVGQVKVENPDRKDNFDTSHYLNVNQKPLSPDDSQKYKYSNLNFASVTTTCDQKFQIADGTEEQSKSQSVTSTFDLQKEDEKKSKNSETKGNRLVRTAASGHTVSSNTITSVQAGKTQTTTVTVNNNSSTPPAISVVNFANQNMLNVPLIPKGNTQTKTPLEMVQSVVSSIQTSKNVAKNEVQPNIVSVNKAVLPTSNVLNNILTSTANINTPILASNNPGAAPVLKTSPGGLQAGHILVSSNGQYIVASSGNIIPQTNLGGLKLNTPSPMPPMSASPVVTNVTGAVTQVLPAVGVAQQVLGQPTVLVNTLPAPFVIQPGVMAVDTGLGRLAVTGNVLQSSLIENNPLRNSMRGLNPSEKSKSKKGNKKRKSQVASLVQMTSPNNVILNQPFGQQNFAVSPGGNVQPLQALTLVQGKHGGPTQIVMNNQNNFNQFSPQPQQINLLQPVNLASVSNFPAFQQFIVPSLGNMVMSTDGTTTILPDTTNIGVQLQLQNVNGQNVLTPVQNTGFLNGQGILTTPAGMLIRAPNNQQKIIQNNSNPQFLSPNSGQFLVNQFQGQLSPLIAANLSPNQQIFTSSPPRQSPQEFIQIIPSSSSQNTTVVQQNTTIVQQQTTMVSNNQNILNNSGKSNFILNNSNVEKPVEVQIVGGTSQRQSQQSQQQQQPPPPSQFQQQPQSQKNLSQEKVDTGTQHSVSTQTIVSKEGNNVSVATNNTFCQTLNSNWSGSPPDTTTHSPLESESNRERTQSPSTDESPEDSVPQAMVQYVSSSMNESESENETYILPSGLPKMLTNCEGLPKSNDKAKNIVESSTILQEAGVQIQIGTNCTSSRNQKSTIDECVVSSHSDVNAQDKHIESHSNVARYQDDKAILVDALLTETRSDDLGEEGIIDVKDKLAEGDLVWGSVRGFPAWPGKLVGPISPGGRVLVRWFGGHSSPTRVNVSQLQSLSQGLDAHHRASNKGRKNRRLNIELEAAIQEAMLELDKMAAKQKKISTGGSARLRRSHR